MSTDDAPEGGVIFEILRIGEVQRVAAIHIESGIEVVIQAPATAARADVQALALRKLERALRTDGDGSPSEGETPRPGKLV